MDAPPSRWIRSRILALRRSAGIASGGREGGDEGQVALGDEIRERRVVYVRVHELEGDLGAKPGRECVEERGVSVGIPEISPLDVRKREPLRGRNDPNWATRLVQ